MSGALLGTSAARTEVGAEQRARPAGAGCRVPTSEPDPEFLPPAWIPPLAPPPCRPQGV